MRRMRRHPRSRPGRSVNPVTGMSESYQDRKDVVIIVKILAAVVVTMAFVLAVVKVTKKGVAKPTYEQRSEAPKTP